MAKVPGTEMVAKGTVSAFSGVRPSGYNPMKKQGAIIGATGR